LILKHVYKVVTYKKGEKVIWKLLLTEKNNVLFIELYEIVKEFQHKEYLLQSNNNKTFIIPPILLKRVELAKNQCLKDFISNVD
jgi:hypothetical protein